MSPHPGSYRDGASLPCPCTPPWWASSQPSFRWTGSRRGPPLVSRTLLRRACQPYKIWVNYFNIFILCCLQLYPSYWSPHLWSRSWRWVHARPSSHYGVPYWARTPAALSWRAPAACTAHSARLVVRFRATSTHSLCWWTLWPPRAHESNHRSSTSRSIGECRGRFPHP